jgi:hypothetical protein
MKPTTLTIVFGTLLVAAIAPSQVRADALASRFEVFEQRPMNGVRTLPGGPPHFGHNEVSTARQLPVLGPFDAYAGEFMADDFAVKSAAPVVTVRWWGSYLQTGITQVDRFLITFEQDVPRRPGDPDGFSHPGKPILSQIVYRDSPPPDRGIFTEMLVQDGPIPLHEPLYEYSANLAVPFKPQRNTVYWLKIVALGGFAGPLPVEGPTWGWHNRDYTQMDPFAPTAPAVDPGEHIAGAVPQRTEFEFRTF